MSKISWSLEGYIGDSKLIRCFRLDTFPFRIGRCGKVQLALDDNTSISRNHAEFVQVGDELILHDLGSTNGTFVNRQKITGEQPLQAGDILHFADQEFRLIGKNLYDTETIDCTQFVGINTLSEKLPQGVREFQTMLLQGAVTAAFQPIVDTEGQVFAYEMLGRGALEGLPSAPWPLFQIAESLDLEVPFSELLRQRGLEIAHQLGPDARYFFNVHPRESSHPQRLLQRLDEVRATYPNLKLVLEVHEGAVTDAALIRLLSKHLKTLDIELAYDDFGAGQARLIELTEVPPDYVKFDMALIRDIDQATEAKRQMLGMFQQFLNGMGIAALAEGVETAAEVEVLHALRMDYYQGYYFGKPNATLELLR